MTAWLARRLKLWFRARPLAVALAALLLVTACTVKPKSREDETTTDFRQISRVFETTQNFYNRPPKDLAEIRSMLADFHKDGLNDEPDQVLTSSRDNEPYLIVLPARLGSEPADSIVLCEKTGLDGVRYVMTQNRQVRQVPEAEFRQLRLANGKLAAAP
ncbi:hypothetical protein NA78x_003034 [Anatilimnocola sp. NA78]|uniref:hypothetical protein n=1 Tax=Anatilimnocola sp. NA78 TaxID=3415683 RepID=UPI003CE5409C